MASSMPGREYLCSSFHRKATFFEQEQILWGCQASVEKTRCSPPIRRATRSAAKLFMKSKLALIPLTLGGFGIGMTEFVMMGILPDIASAMRITIPEAGHFISAYALGVVVGAPLLVALTGKLPPKKILALLMGMFAIGNALSLLAPNYEIMLLTRFISGLPHGAF